MPTTLIDSRDHKSAVLTSRGELHVRAIEQSYRRRESIDGNAYNFNTGDVTLTDANENAVAYFKNNEAADVVIDTLIYMLGTSTGGSGDFLVGVRKNPTGGTIIDDASAATLANQNFGSNKTLSDSLAYKATGNGKTLTGGTADVVYSRFSSSGRYVVALGGLVIPKGSSIGIDVQCPTSNTSCSVAIAMSITLDDGSERLLDI